MRPSPAPLSTDPALLPTPASPRGSGHTPPRAGLALAPWDVLAGGKLRTDAEEAHRRETGEKGRTIFGAQWERTADERAMSAALETVAHELGAQSIQAGA